MYTCTAAVLSGHFRFESSSNQLAKGAFLPITGMMSCKVPGRRWDKGGGGSGRGGHAAQGAAWPQGMGP